MTLIFALPHAKARSCVEAYATDKRTSYKGSKGIREEIEPCVLRKLIAVLAQLPIDSSKLRTIATIPRGSRPKVPNALRDILSTNSRTHLHLPPHLQHPHTSLDSRLSRL